MDPSKADRKTRAFTLVELLVVIAIIGILIALLLPAVQAAREAARRLQCKNHLKQLGVAVLMHEETFRFFPSGGWGHTWVGDPDRGMGEEQPAGWVYATLPFIEQEDLHQLGADGEPKYWTTTQLNGARERIEMPLAMHSCPSRRAAIAYPTGNLTGGVTHDGNGTHTPYGASPTTIVARTDYSMCAGDQFRNWSPAGPGPPTLTEAAKWTRDDLWPLHEPEPMTGISYLRSEVKLRDVTDGTTNTYMIGEKGLNPDRYFDGVNLADNESMYCGYNNDIYRTTFYDGTWSYFIQDRAGYNNNTSFGSAHTAGCHMALCDGSVRMISYDIDREIHRRLGNIHDGQVVDKSEF